MRRKRILIAGLALFAAALAAFALWPSRVSFVRPSALVVEDREGGWLRAFPAPDGVWRVPAARDSLPPHLVEAVLAFEDARFFVHPGVDPLALARAAFDGLRAGRVVSGGSTLTMQIARMLERRPRTFTAKLVEMVEALRLELRFSKDALLTAYLDLAPYGGNIEGVGAAAWFYFGKDVSRLTVDEAATLAAIPNAPGRLAPRLGEPPPAALLARRNDVLRRMAARGAIPPEIAEEARALPLSIRRRPAPMTAPHASEHLRTQARAGASRVRATIDPEMQRRADELLRHHVALLAKRGIHSGSVVVIENETRAIRALVGSPSFADVAADGQVDGARAFRSPGSTLKPFVFALALDRGLIGVSSALEDVPIAFKDWSPENFDGRHRGLVSAADALRTSLNIPAVELAERLQPSGLVELLHRAGFGRFARGLSRYGLSTVLGGCEVSLLELTNLYATLGSAGRHASPRWVEDAPPAETTPLFSPGAAYLVTEILSDVRRPELPDVWKDAASIPRVAWKTGTSYGRRDAWTIGYDRRFTVGVWIGNFDGTSARELVGVEAAAPLFFALFEALSDRFPGDRWPVRPPEVGPRDVCPLSGAAPGPGCPHVRSELALLDRAPRETCGLHVLMEVDDRTRARLCSRCRSGRAYHEEQHVVLPPRTRALARSQGLPEVPIPEHDARCLHGLAGRGPRVRSPMHGDEFLLREGVPRSAQQVALLAAADSGSSRIFWFVDGELVAEVEPGRAAMWTPEPGRHRLVAVDGEGRATNLEVNVRAPLGD